MFRRRGSGSKAKVGCRAGMRGRRLCENLAPRDQRREGELRPTGEAVLGTNDEVDVTLVDNDSSLSWQTNAVSIAESGGSVTLTGLVASPIGRSEGLAKVISVLDSWGFDVGAARISVWTVLVALVVIAGLIVFARFASRIAARAAPLQCGPAQYTTNKVSAGYCASLPATILPPAITTKAWPGCRPPSPIPPMNRSCAPVCSFTCSTSPNFPVTGNLALAFSSHWKCAAQSR